MANEEIQIKKRREALEEEIDRFNNHVASLNMNEFMMGDTSDGGKVN
jgi:hypothetical protein